MRRVPLPIFTVVMSSELGNNMLAPLLTFIFFAANSPLFLATATTTERSLLFGLCLSLYKLAGIVANSVLAALSDHYGRKMALYCTLIGLLIVTCCGAIALQIHNATLFISGFFLVGLLDTNKAIAPAIVGDISNDQNLVTNMATIQCVIAIGACLGPMIGGRLANHTWLLQTPYLLPFVIAAIVAIIALVITYFCPETLVSTHKPVTIPLKQIAQDYWSLLRSQQCRWLFLLLILCQISWSSYYEFIPPVLSNIFHFSPARVGVFVGLIAFWLIVASGLIMRWLSRFLSYQQLLWSSSIAIAFGALLSLYASETPTYAGSHTLLWIGAIPIAMGDVIFFSLFTALLSKAVPAHQQGKAMGLTLLVAMLVWSLTALLGGYLLTLYANGALLFAPIGAVGLLLIFGLHKTIFNLILGERSTI